MKPLQGFARLGNSDGRRATALVSLSADNLVAMGAHTHSKLRPSVEVVSSGDSSAAALVPADGPVLIEGGGICGDGRLVHLLVGVDIVDGSIRSYGSLEGHAAAGVVFAVVLHDIIFNKRASGPAVNGKVSVSGGLERAGHFDVSSENTHKYIYQRLATYARLTGRYQ